MISGTCFWDLSFCLVLGLSYGMLNLLNFVF